ncbi:BIC1-like protein, partial [Tanacetum coccineum]
MDTHKNPNLETTKTTTTTPQVVHEESGREKLKRHRVEMAGRVWIPDIWGQEDCLNDWIDCTVFDSSLGNNTIMSARKALVQEARST